jgi:hypothetical protein
MCTVSFVPVKGGFILTSNRDELHSRPTLPPLEYLMDGRTLTFPRDEQAGGSWIALDDGHRVACLLNGAQEPHRHNLPYSRSRGLLVQESLVYGQGLASFCDAVHLDGVEPFTLLLFGMAAGEGNYQLIWDGVRRSVRKLVIDSPQLWQSVTLYDADMRKERQAWFEQWLRPEDARITDSLWAFHTNRHGTDPHKDIVMHRGDLKTVSVTQCRVLSGTSAMRYDDTIGA